ncbi:FAD-dependent oxidoreductase [Streptomyces longwoodensis]|uniref:FAD-dependent oxidoreductase n=1 Tax=Streptomyces longwoodensis TaxID=68231 RepID=UPI0036FF2596
MTTTPDHSVIVVGAGPTGLALACELAAAGVSCTVLERRLTTSAQSRAMGLYARTLEVLDLRGHADALTAYGRPVGRLHPARGAVVDFTELDTRFPALHVVPQSRTEEVLQDHALKLGVTLVRDAEVFGLEQDDSGVTLQVRAGGEEWEETADYVVGCDGAHSAVRELSGIAFRGRTYDIAPVLADVRLRKPPPVDDVVVLAGNGAVMVTVPYGDGLYRVAVARRDRPWTREPVTLEELGELMSLSLGFDPEPYEPAWLARFKIHQRLADHYRTGRVLLAGDAAHLHSPLGGQGLNLGIQDAVNLGWKLAARIQGWAPPGLLDSYEAERRPQAARILRATDRATWIATSPSPALTALRRTALARLLGSRRVRRVAGEAISGLRSDYARRGGGRALRAGQRVPDLTVRRPGATPVRLYELMRDGRFLLLDLTPAGRAAALGEAWGSRVCPVRVEEPPARLAGLSTLLVRPDGYVAWADGEADAEGHQDRVRRTLLHWCGAEGPTARGAAPVAVRVPERTATQDGAGAAPGPRAASDALVATPYAGEAGEGVWGEGPLEDSEGAWQTDPVGTVDAPGTGAPVAAARDAADDAYAGGAELAEDVRPLRAVEAVHGTTGGTQDGAPEPVDAAPEPTGAGAQAGAVAGEGARTSAGAEHGEAGRP